MQLHTLIVDDSGIMSTQQETVNTLESLTAQILAMDPSDKETIMQVGSTLEPLPDYLPDSFEEVSGLLTLALEALQGLYEETVSDASAALIAIAEAVEAARARLAGETEPGDGSISLHRTQLQAHQLRRLNGGRTWRNGHAARRSAARFPHA